MSMTAGKTRVLVLLLLGLFGAAADAQEAKDMLLENSGFVIRPALTTRQLDRLRLLPPGQFIARTKNGQRYFLYADPDLCKCVFVGNALAMAKPEFDFLAVDVLHAARRTKLGSARCDAVSGYGSQLEQFDSRRRHSRRSTVTGPSHNERNPRSGFDQGLSRAYLLRPGAKPRSRRAPARARRRSNFRKPSSAAGTTNWSGRIRSRCIRSRFRPACWRISCRG